MASGLGAFCIAVCALLMNTQIVGEAYGNYAGSYLAVSLIVFAGLAMLKGVQYLNMKKAEECIPFAATLVGTAFFGDITIGIAFGVVLYCIFKVIDKSRKEIKLTTIILGVILAVYAFIALKYGGNFVTAVMGGPGGPGGGPM